MDAFTTHTGTAAPLRRSDIDTDQIIPSEWLKRVERTGFAAGLFSQWRKDPNFALNRYPQASILLTGSNFGTGSSREHAVWALQEHGFRAVISPRFADIFRSNALKGGLLPVQLPAEVVEQLMTTVERDPETAVTVDLQAREVRAGGLVAQFELDDFARWRLMAGLDDIGLTLQYDQQIRCYEAGRQAFLPQV